MVRAKWTKRPFRLPSIRWAWIVTLALIPQFLAFYVPITASTFSKEAATISLVVSQFGLLLFLWLNRSIRAFYIVGLGLILNLLVIVANGGLMPISPDTIATLAPDVPRETWVIGERLGRTKDVILPAEQMRLPWLADRFVTPSWYPEPTAFSFGDIVLAFGIVLFFWQASGHRSNRQLDVQLA
ncbi:MAG: DUF5317 domain-containing protein [Caldilineaceae bacterium]|nr:DUF5317 domain-containing protein [Caldilineaceae bacterium]